jgi:DNA mismatch endonuclease, patch repair protein
VADVFTKSKRSYVMSRIRSRDTAPERAVRSMLHGMGHRFRLHRTDLPGKPDIVLPRFGTAILVHGCFWHRHAGCRFAYTPKSRTGFWLSKFASNVARDQNVKKELAKLGWKTIIVWECELESPERLLVRLTAALHKNAGRARRPRLLRG